MVLHREATAALPEVARAEVGTLRQKLWKAGAVVQTSVRRIWVHFSETWPHRELFVRVCQAVRQFVAGLRREAAAVPLAAPLPPM